MVTKRKNKAYLCTVGLVCLYRETTVDKSGKYDWTGQKVKGQASIVTQKVSLMQQNVYPNMTNCNLLY